jgi:glycosyltransferase involved in cell wall biosynthesis
LIAAMLGDLFARYTDAGLAVASVVDRHATGFLYHERDNWGSASKRVMADRFRFGRKMNSNSLVSIIVPFFNTAKFLRESIESVLAQTYGHWELLLVDDGSTDGSRDIALRYVEGYPSQVYYLMHEGHRNRGIPVTRNLGIRHARGEYIALLDADDVWLPQKLKRQVTIMNSQPEAAMVCGPSQYWFSWTGSREDIGRDFLNHLRVQTDTLLKPPTWLTLSIAKNALTPCPSNILVRREVVERIGGFEESFVGVYQTYEDQAFLAKLVLNAPVYVASEYLDRYRKHPESCVSIVKKAGQTNSARLYYLRWLEDYLFEHGMKDRVLWQTLRKELWTCRHPCISGVHQPLLRMRASSVDSLKSVARRIVPLATRSWLRGNDKT